MIRELDDRRGRDSDRTFKATRTDPQARLALSLGSTGRVWIDFVSLFPEKTFKNRPNGLRPDLAQLIADLKPGFVRWPGGCFAEGITIESRPQWKRSLGRLEDRDRHLQPVGLLDARTASVTTSSCSSARTSAPTRCWSSTSASPVRSAAARSCLTSALPGLIQDALDAIEYAIGPATLEVGRDAREDTGIRRRSR